MLLICLSNERCESKVTPRLFTWSVSAICTSAIVTDAECFSIPTIWAVPNKATFDLSGLRVKELWTIHSHTVSMQPARSRVAFDKLSLFAAREICVSSAYWCNLMAKLDMISPSGIVNWTAVSDIFYPNKSLEVKIFSHEKYLIKFRFALYLIRKIWRKLL